MRGAWMAGVGAIVFAAGCAGNRAQQLPEEARADGAATGGSGPAASRYVDANLGFEISRPSPDWQMDVTPDAVVDGIAIPVILRHMPTGAQVVVHVSPAFATPFQLAERLTEGMRANPAVSTSDPTPLPLSDDAVGFDFALGDRVLGRVAVRNGAHNTVLMLLGSWPAGAPDEVIAQVDVAFRSVLPQGGDAVHSASGGSGEDGAPPARPLRPNEI